MIDEFGHRFRALRSAMHGGVHAEATFGFCAATSDRPDFLQFQF